MKKRTRGKGIPKSAGKILIIEDDLDTSFLFQAVLESGGFKVELSATGADALLKLENPMPYDLFLLDYTLPDMDGKLLIEKIKARNISTPFIVITATNDANTAVEMMKLGAMDYLVKEKDFIELITPKVLNAFKQIDLRQRLLLSQLELEGAEKRFQALVEKSQVGIFIEQNRKLTYVNPELSRITGYSRQELFGLDRMINLVADAQERKLVKKLFEKLYLEKEDSLDLEIEIITKKGAPCILHLYAGKTHIREEFFIFGSLLDITGKKRAQEEQEKVLHNVLEAITNPLMIIEVRNFSIRYANSAVGAGKKTDNKILKCHALLHSFAVSCDKKGIGCLMQEVKKTKAPAVLEHVLKYNGKIDKVYELFGYPIFDTSGKLVQLIEYSVDISERKKSERRINFLTEELLRTQELERQRIAQELHDGVGQTLMASLLSFQTFENEWAGNSANFKIGLEMLKAASQELSEVYTNLFPSTLKELGLESAIRSLAKNFLQTRGIKTKIQTKINEKMAGSMEIHLYRIVQEAFSNIVKHAGATWVSVRLFPRSAKSMVLQITDNGIGMEASFRKSKKTGFGLENIKYRVERMSGKFSMGKAGTSGNKIRIEIPLLPENGEKE